jgi:acyl-CoA thioesterase YciA
MSRPIHVPRDSTRMPETQSQDFETLTHRLVLPRDANHHGTLYAGTLLALALEAGYATAFRAAGLNANLVLKRVLDLRCYEPVPVGQVVQIRGRQIHRGSAQIVVALWGTPLPDRLVPWMDGAMQFVQVDECGRPEPLEEEPDDQPIIVEPPWSGLQERTRKLLRVRQ